jgi:hypothetical protein
MKAVCFTAEVGRAQADKYSENAVCTKDIENYMNMVFGPGAWVYDDDCDAFIAVDTEYRGRGVRFIAVRRDLSENEKRLLPHELH